jgi:hypothetical protein
VACANLEMEYAIGIFRPKRPKNSFCYGNLEAALEIHAAAFLKTRGFLAGTT